MARPGDPTLCSTSVNGRKQRRGHYVAPPCSPVTREPPGGESCCQRRRPVLVGRLCSLLAHQRQGLDAVFLDRGPLPSSTWAPRDRGIRLINVRRGHRVGAFAVATNAQAAAQPTLLIGHPVRGAAHTLPLWWSLSGARGRPICKRSSLVASSREGKESPTLVTFGLRGTQRRLGWAVMANRLVGPHVVRQRSCGVVARRCHLRRTSRPLTAQQIPDRTDRRCWIPSFLSCCVLRVWVHPRVGLADKRAEQRGSF